MCPISKKVESQILKRQWMACEEAEPLSKRKLKEKGARVTAGAPSMPYEVR